MNDTPNLESPFLEGVGYWRLESLLSTDMASAVERLGYSAIWIGGSPDADLAIVGQVLDATEHLVVATGVVNIWKAPAKDVAASFHRLDDMHPGRFILGIGIGHREADGERYRHPYQALVAYLDVLDAEGVPPGRRVISALGPRTLTLAAKRSLGTHPYLSTPTHTRFARSLVGEGPLIAPEQRLIAETDAQKARAVARDFLSRYLGLSNYRRTLESHGFTASELNEGATDQAVDALAPHGSSMELAAVVQGHFAAGADHVCIQMLPAKGDPLRALASLSDALGLR